MKQKQVFNLAEKKTGIINSITDLMLDKFIICMCDGDLSYLVTDWTNVTEEDVKEAWEKILDEYTDLLKNREQLHLEQVSKELNILITKRNVINACLYRLSIEYSDEIVDELKKWTLVIEKFDQSNTESYFNDLQNIRNRNTRLDIDIRHLQEELKSSLPEGIERTNDKFSFERNLIQLQKHMGHSINKFETSVASYALMLVDLIMKAEEAERQMNYHA